MQKLLLFGSLLLLTFGFLGCAHVEEPQFRSIRNFKVRRLGFQQADIALGVEYFNPNNFGVHVKEAVVDIYLDTVYMGKFSQPTAVAVDKKAAFTIPLEGSVPVAKALQLKLGDLVNREVSVSATGAIRVGKAGVFVRKDINYKGRHRLDITL